MLQIRIGGVPEHFNLPIHLAIEQGLFEEEGISIQWKNYEGGTGQMSEALENDECDICLVLTEGIISAISYGNPSKIISGYVKSPLIWGVHTGKKSYLKFYSEIFDKQIAISRIGSGSHLMPKVDAMMKGRKVVEDQFIEVKNIDGAIESLNKGETDVFYWEKFTTKPYVEQNKLNKIGEFVSPWPCFIIAATDKIIDEHPETLDKLLHIIHRSCEKFMDDPEAAQEVSRRYNISVDDASRWFHATEWATDSWVSDKMISNVLFTLKEAGLLPKNAKLDNLIWKRNRK